MSAARRLVVDGYNVIRSTEPYRRIAESDMDSARAALVSDVAGYAGQEWKAVVVFDGGANPLSDGVAHETGGIQVIFSKVGLDADSVIERLVSEAKERGEEVHVVTSDAQTQWAVLGSTVRRRSAGEFSEELRDDRAEWGEHLPSGSRSVPVEERIDEDVRAVLEKWARGER